ncbi:hypothetical protein OAB23_02835 [Candidatus Pelagibacter ubique]|nr:hypothetical protein [Candidatus Pelagibacter ubique]
MLEENSIVGAGSVITKKS